MELVLVVSVIMYFAPSIIGFMRGHASKWAIFAMNLFLGWSVLFWFWSYSGHCQTRVAIKQ